VFSEKRRTGKKGSIKISLRREREERGFSSKETPEVVTERKKKSDDKPPSFFLPGEKREEGKG